MTLLPPFAHSREARVALIRNFQTVSLERLSEKVRRQVDDVRSDA
jgi:hypothetical protein